MAAEILLSADLGSSPVANEQEMEFKSRALLQLSCLTTAFQPDAIAWENRGPLARR